MSYQMIRTGYEYAWLKSIYQAKTAQLHHHSHWNESPLIQISEAEVTGKHEMCA